MTNPFNLFKKKRNSNCPLEKLYLELPKVIDSYGGNAIKHHEEIISISMSRELAYLLGFVDYPTKGEFLIMIQNTTKHAPLSSHQRIPNSSTSN